jgi:hypothetical protein
MSVKALDDAARLETAPAKAITMNGRLKLE